MELICKKSLQEEGIETHIFVRLCACVHELPAAAEPGLVPLIELYFVSFIVVQSLKEIEHLDTLIQVVSGKKMQSGVIVVEKQDIY